MAQSKECVGVLKKALKKADLTYADVAKHLKISEASVKRSFAKNNFTLQRIENICSLLGMDFTGLAQLTDDQQAKISMMTVEQEKELVSDLKFLLVAICVQNAWQMDEIVKYYEIPELQCLRYLIRLERHGLIRLLPNNHVRRMLSQDFKWIPQGPIESFFEGTVQHEFLNSHFTRSREQRTYMMGMLSINSIEVLNNKLDMLAREFSLLQQDDARLPASARFNTGMMLAIRPWELSLFASLKQSK